jgi:hypothetical protein
MDPHPLTGLFKRPNYEEPIASELSAELLENDESNFFATLKSYYENYAPNAYVSKYIKGVFATLEEEDDMYESIDNYDSIDLIEISPLDECDACFSYGHDANINDAYGDELAIVTYVENEIIAIAPTLDSSLNEKHDCNDVIINSIIVNCVNNMQNPSLGMLILPCLLLIAMIMIGVIMLLMILIIYLILMMNMLLKVGLERS